MESKISLCGDDCSVCPRYQAKTEEELLEVANLWYKTGMRDHIVTTDEIKCFGCSVHNNCSYQLYQCIEEHEVKKCKDCREYPCKKVIDMLNNTKHFENECKKLCTEKEFNMLRKAFFKKEKNLNR